MRLSLILFLQIAFTCSVFSQDVIKKLSEATCKCIYYIEASDDINSEIELCISKASEVYQFALEKEYGENYWTNKLEQIQTALLGDLIQNCEEFVSIIKAQKEAERKANTTQEVESSEVILTKVEWENGRIRTEKFNGGEIIFNILTPWDKWEDLKDSFYLEKPIEVLWREMEVFSPKTLDFIKTKVIDNVNTRPITIDNSIKTLRGHDKSILTTAISHDGRFFYSGGNDNTIKIWEPSSDKEIHSLTGHQSGIWSMDISKDNTILISSGSSDKTIKMWNLEKKEPIKTLKGHKYTINTVSINESNELLVSGGGEHEDLMSELILWEIGTSKKVDLIGHQEPVYGVKFDPKSKYIVSGDKSGKLILWDVSEQKMIKSIQAHDEAILCLDISIKGNLIATGSRDGLIKIWSLPKLDFLKELQGHSYIVRDVKFSSDSKKLVSGSNDRKVILWDYKTGKIIKTLEGHASSVFSVDFFNGDKNVISGSWDRSLKIWDISE